MYWIIVIMLSIFGFILGIYLSNKTKTKKKSCNCKYKDYRLYYSDFTKLYYIQYNDYFQGWIEEDSLHETLQDNYKTKEEAILALDDYLDKSAKCKIIELC